MSIIAAQLVVEVSAKGIEGVENALKRTGKATEAAKEHSDGFLKGMFQFAGAELITRGVGAAFSYVKDNALDMVQAGMQGNQIMAQLAAGLKSTNDASGQTIDSLDRLSHSIMSQTGIDDDAVKAGESMLLTFENIGKKTFPQATQAVADLATKMAGGAVPSAQQMQQAALQLGKALGDPVKGYAQLQRIGVTFSAEQVKQIKNYEATGQLAKAQGVILGEMNKEFGGSAKAAGDANGGLAKFTATLDDMKQSVGQSLIPILTQVAQVVFPILESGMKGVGDFVTQTLVPGLQTLAPVFRALWDYGKLIFATFEFGLKPGLEKVGQAFQKLMPHVNGVSGFMRILIPVLRQVQTFALNLGTTIGKILAQAVTTILPILANLASWFMAKVLPAVMQFAGFVANNVIPVIIQLVGWFGQHVVPVLQTLVDVFLTNVLPALEDIWQNVAHNLIPAIEALYDRIEPFLVPILKTLGFILQHVVGPAFSGIIDVASILIGIVAGVINIVQKVGGIIFWLVGQSLKPMLDNFKIIVDFLKVHFKPQLDALGAGFQTIGGWVQTLLGWLGKAKDALGGVFSNIGNAGKALHIPGFATGGTMADTGLAVVGERGPELMRLPGGTHITPLQQGASSLMSMPTALSGGALGGGRHGTEQTIVVQLDGRTLAAAVVKEMPRQVRLSTGLKI